MLTAKITFISIAEGEFKDDKGTPVKYYRMNCEFANGELVKDIRFEKGACDGLNKYETVIGFFRVDTTKKNAIVFTGYKR